jgi:hypothetical protein
LFGLLSKECKTGELDNSSNLSSSKHKETRSSSFGIRKLPML